MDVSQRGRCGEKVVRGLAIAQGRNIQGAEQNYEIQVKAILDVAAS